MRHLRCFRLALFVVGALASPVPSTSEAEAKALREGHRVVAPELPAKEVACASREQGAEQQIRDLEAQINAAVVTGDLHVFERLLADDFTHTNQSGIFRTKAQWLANHKPGQSPYDAYDVDDLRIRVYGDTAVVTARTTPRGRGSKAKPITGRYRYLRVWAKRDGQWRAVAFQGTRIAP
jgi:ketosteroid isomerase-like protein